MTIEQARKERRKDSVTVAIRRFFKDNPGEELTYDDLELKFGIRDRQLYSLIGKLKAEGTVDVLHVVKGLRYGGNT